MELDILLTLAQQGKVFANPRRIALLKQIQASGSISQGAKQAKISYKAAWDAVNEMNTLADAPLVERAVGGKGGGGAQLTRLGERLLQMYDLLEQIQAKALHALQDERVPLHSLLGVMARFSLQTSARNQLFGVVERIEPESFTELVHIRLAGGQRLCAEITRNSHQRLQLAPGKEVLALFKAPVMGLKAPGSQPDGVNHLQGTVTRVERDQQATNVELALQGDELIYAVVDNSEADPLKIGVGVPLVATVERDQVLLATLG